MEKIIEPCTMHFSIPPRNEIFLNIYITIERISHEQKMITDNFFMSI